MDFLAGAAATVLAVELFKSHKKNKEAKKERKQREQSRQKVKDVFSYHLQSKKSNCIVFGKVSRCSHKKMVGVPELKAILADCNSLQVFSRIVWLGIGTLVMILQGKQEIKALIQFGLR